MYQKSVLVAVVFLSFVSLSMSFKNLEKDGCPETVQIACPCGKNQTQMPISVKVKACAINYKRPKGTKCEPCQEEAAEACRSFKNCDLCPMDDNDDPVCVRLPTPKNKNAKVDIMSPTTGFPIHISIRPEVNKKRRVVREDKEDEEDDVEKEVEKAKKEELDEEEEEEEPGACEVFSDLETAEVKCWMWPTYVTCEETCLSGYEIDDGQKSRSSKCMYNKPDTWLPKTLDECKQVVNCHVMLATPGDLMCHMMTVEPPHCYISCQPYDDEPYVPLREYECDKEYEPPLPHCAKLDPRYDV